MSISIYGTMVFLVGKEKNISRRLNKKKNGSNICQRVRKGKKG